VLPSSLLGLVLFVVLLAPGFAYGLRHERMVPQRQSSPFRETLRVVFASVICLTITGLIFAGLRWLFPERTVDVGALVRDPGDFARSMHVELAWWFLALIALATALGAIAADRRLARVVQRVGRWKPARWVTASSKTDIQRTSVWNTILRLYEGRDPGPVDVGAQLDDGSYVRGWLYTHSVRTIDDENRDLVLHAPLFLTTAAGTEVKLNTQFMVVSARRIVRLDVTHMPPMQMVSLLSHQVVRPHHLPRPRS
jgi:hypothetical protein